MATFGSFSSAPIDYRSRLINPDGSAYRGNLPTNLGGTLPIGSRVPPQPMTSSPRIPPPTDIGGSIPKIVPRFIPPVIVPTGGLGDAPPPPPPPDNPTSPPVTGGGSSTGNQTGGTGTTDTSRLFDLIAQSFKPQEIQQGYGPQSVSDTNLAPASGGTNPMAIVILAILVMAGVFLYANKKKKAAA